MTFVLALAVLSLLTGWDLHTGFSKLRPFDPLAAGLLLYVLFHGDLRRQLRLPIGFLLALPFLYIHVLSAFVMGDVENGFRETLQVGVLVAFALAAGFMIGRIQFDRFTRYMIIGLAAIMIVSIAWHVSQGYLTGWKRLDEPKLVFTILPLFLGVRLAVKEKTSSHRIWLWLAWGGVGAAVFFSGERKALLAFGVMSALLIGGGRVLHTAAVAGAAGVALVIAASVMEEGYLTRQLQTITQPGVGEPAYDLQKHVAGIHPRSISNAQRAFAFDRGMELFQEHPIFGVGTNVYKDIIDKEYGYLPDYLTLAIHGEFFRTLVENGVVGFLAYSLIWGASLYRSVRLTGAVRRTYELSPVRYRLLLAVIFIPFLTICTFEASGSEAMLILLLVSLAPDFIEGDLIRRRYQAPAPGVAPGFAQVHAQGLSQELPQSTSAAARRSR